MYRAQEEREKIITWLCKYRTETSQKAKKKEKREKERMKKRSASQVHWVVLVYIYITAHRTVSSPVIFKEIYIKKGY